MSATATSHHFHDYSISITAADVPEYLLPELSAMLEAKLAELVRDQMVWGDLRVQVDYDGRQQCDRPHAR